VDHGTRLAYVEVLGNEESLNCCHFSQEVHPFTTPTVCGRRRMMTDKRLPYVSHVHAAACRELPPQVLASQLILTLASHGARAEQLFSAIE
jgi:hypothetical protein